MSRNTAEHAAIFYGILKLGAVFTPLNPSYTSAEVARQVDHATPRVLIVESGMAERCREGVSRAQADPRLVMVGGASGPGEIGIAEMLEGASHRMPEVLVDESDLAMVMYTSGTESVPKGVAITHRAMMISTHSLVVL